MKHSDKEHSAVTTTDDHAVLTVLLVDDSQTVRQSARKCLESEGYKVVTAADGFEALAQVVEHCPALVLVDIMMPRLDGYQTCALIKNNADLRHTPVVMLSSKDGLFDKARGTVVGSDAHLSKPFTEESLLSMVRRFTDAASTVSDRQVASTRKAGKPPETTDA